MKIILSNASADAFYEQIYKQIAAMIMNGRIKPDVMLPSIRKLAVDLGVSVITVKKAYERLELNGFINTMAGKGCFAAKLNPEQIENSRRKMMEKDIKQIVSNAKKFGINIEELNEMIWEEHIKED